MSAAQYLRDLLRPLGVYDLAAPFSGGELDAAGKELDEIEELLEEIGQETCLATAEGWGAEKWAALFARRPMAEGGQALAKALAALLRISGDSFTLADINDTVSGCGIPAQVTERGVGQVTVSFPGVAGEPAGFVQLKELIEAILPAHLDIEYWFWYLTWAELESKFASWQAIEDLDLTWTGLETHVE